MQVIRPGAGLVFAVEGGEAVAAALDEASVDLVLDGVDTVADVAVNGRLVARLENAHR